MRPRSRSSCRPASCLVPRPVCRHLSRTAFVAALGGAGVLAQAQQPAVPAAPASSPAAATDASDPGATLGRAPTAAGPGVAGGDEGYSMLPYTTRGYLGINVGQAKFGTACGTGGYACDDPRVSGYFYTGGLFNDWLGVELGYMNSGRAERAGGRSRAEGLAASLLLRAPMGPFSAFVKGGALYGETKVSAGPLSDVTPGKRRGWAPVFGGGLGYDFTAHHGVVLEWSRAKLRFPGEDERRKVDTTSLGYVYRF